MILHPYRRIAGLTLLALLLAVTFFAGIAVGITFAAPRSASLPSASLLVDERLFGAPHDPGADQAADLVVSSARDPLNGRGSPRHRPAFRGAETAGSSGAPTPSAAQPSVQTVSVSGIASWYADGPGLYAAVPSWSWGDTPYTAQVCGYEGGRTNCLLVTVRDSCQCYVGTNRERVIDLSPAAFRSLAPLSQGLVTVTVEWLP